MSLDRANGEVLDGLPASMYVRVEARELANLTNVKTECKIKKKFGFRTAQRPIFDDAVAFAIEGFASAGALRPIRFDEDDVLVQVYPKDMKVAVIFQRRVAGEDWYVSRVYDLPKPVIESLLEKSGKAPREH